MPESLFQKIYYKREALAAQVIYYEFGKIVKSSRY